MYNRFCCRGSTSYAPLAQLAEHLTLNQGVQGSNPWRRTITEISDFMNLGSFLFYDLESGIFFVLRLAQMQCEANEL